MSQPLSPSDIEGLRRLPLPGLMAEALAVKLAARGDRFSLCTIINAKSGQCSENCAFCVQSAHFRTDAPVYPLKDRDEIVAAAREAKRIGSGRFSLVTSGRGPTDREVERIAAIVAAIRDEVDIPVCASLGIMNARQLRVLKQAGLSRYHHNLETSREFFPKVATTHTFDERVATIRAAREAELEVCAGGIVGLGESEEDWISLAITLRDLEVDSVPFNILMPLPGTPLAHREPLAPERILRAVALFRLIVRNGALRLCAGRESALGDLLGLAFMAGADAMMIGGYLTQRGRSPEEDLLLVKNIRTVWKTTLPG
ncbi:MAG: biotin synthase BioB [Thermodesulfobacteriota bacterium]